MDMACRSGKLEMYFMFCVLDFFFVWIGFDGEDCFSRATDVSLCLLSVF